MVDIALLEHCIREDLNVRAPRIMAVLRPLRVIIDNYPAGQVEWLETENNQENPAMGSRQIPFSREIYIEQEDFMEDPPKKFFRLRPGGEIRLKSAYIIKCEEVIKDEKTGEIVELHCSYDPDSRSGGPNSGRKVKGTSHWVSAAHAVPAEVRLYEQLFEHENPDEIEGDYKEQLNPDSLLRLSSCMLEPSIREAASGSRFQFLRQGYFYIDPVDSKEGRLFINRIVSLRDSWAKAQKKA